MQFSDLKDSFLGKGTFSNGAAYSDLDNDGDLDLVVNNIDEKATIYQNNTLQKGLTLAVTRPSKTNKGTKVTVFKGEKKMSQSLQTTKGFQSGSTHRLHFGVPSQTIDSLIVQWPNGTIEVRKDIAPLSFMEIEFAEEDTFKKTVTQSSVSAPFTITVLPTKYEDNYYLDYERERLIPEKLSSEGRTLVVEDFNQDGIDDLFLGGARYQPSEIWLGSKTGAYEKIKISAFLADRNFEDVDAATIDIDLDGDRDLYVVSGGNDLEQEDRYMMDRIYLNDDRESLQEER